jgi:hypothetical protein
VSEKPIRPQVDCAVELAKQHRNSSSGKALAFIEQAMSSPPGAEMVGRKELLRHWNHWPADKRQALPLAADEMEQKDGCPPAEGD